MKNKRSKNFIHIIHDKEEGTGKDILSGMDSRAQRIDTLPQKLENDVQKLGILIAGPV